MRRAVLILVLSAACASGMSHRNAFRIDVLEQRGQRITMTGPHLYTVRLTNVSSESIEVESITLAPAGPSEVTFDDAMQTIGDTLSAGESREFEMFVTIDARGRASSQFTPNVDSVNVSIACRSDSGNFVDSE